MLNVPTYQPTWHQNLARHASEARYPHLWEGMVGAWQPGLGPTGLTLHDLSGRGNNGTLENADWVLDDGRYCLEFGGTDERVVAGINLFSSDIYTVSLWAKFGLLNSYQALFSVYTSNTDACEIFVFNTNLRLFGGNFIDPAMSSVSSLNTTDWFYVVLTSDGTVLKLYLDGKASGGPGTTHFSTFSAETQIGSRNDMFPFTGKIEDIVVYDNRVLPLIDMRLHYQLGRGGWLAKRQRVFAKAPVAPSEEELIIGPWERTWNPGIMQPAWR